MKLSKDELKSVYSKLQNKRKKLLRRSLLLALFVLGVNIYAWFIFLNQSQLKVEGNVASWSVTFYDGSEEVQDLTISERLYPGMDTYNKKLSVRNDGEMPATFEYSIHDLTILGKSIDTTNQTSTINSLKGDYPFIFEMTSDKTEIDPDEMLDFDISISWDYEDIGTRPYYKLTSAYDFSPDFTYYTLSGSTYSKATNITSANFVSNRANLYLERDDADTYFGEECGKYQKSTGKACVEYTIHVVVQQKNE